MKLYRVLLFALAVLAVGAILLPLTASAATWNPPYNLGSGSTKPSVAIDSQGNIHYVWWEPTARDIKYAVCAGLTKNTCSAVETLPNNGGDSYYPEIAFDPQERPNVVWDSRDGGSYSVYWSRRENGQWAPIQKVSAEPYSEVPDIAIGPQGIIHVVYQSKQNNTVYMYYVESADGFGTQHKTELANHQSDAPLGAISDTPEAEGQQLTNGLYPRVTVDPDDRAHVVWNAPSPYGIYYRIQQSDGSFAKKITVSQGHKDQTPDIAYSPNGSIGILWGTYDNFNVAFAEYNNGQRDLIQYDVDGGVAQSLRPRIGIDCTGLYYFVFQGKVTADSSWDIFTRTYDASANRFGKRVTIGNSGQKEETPAVAATNIGAIVYANTESNLTMGSTADLGITCDTTPTDTPTATDTSNETPTPTATNTSDPSVTATETPTATATSTSDATATATDTATVEPSNTPTDAPTATPTVTPASGSEHIPSNDPRIVYNGTWKEFKDRDASDKAFTRCGGKKVCKKNWSAELSFTGGTRVEWETAYAKTYGKVKVLIDGKPFEQIDLCKLNRNSKAPRFRIRSYILSGDDTTAHSIKIVALGRHSKCSPYDSKFVSVDGFNIIR